MKIMKSKEAVSPVIAVILMVAITVVLAATVYVWVSGFGSGGEQTPAVNFSVDETSDRLEVISADPTANWNRLAIRASAATVVTYGAAANATVNSEVTADSDYTIPVTNYKLATASDLISAGDFIDLEGALGIVTDITFTIIDTTSNTVVGEYTFTSIAQLA